MKRILTSLVIALMLSRVVFAQEPAAAPKLECDTPIYEFGTVSDLPEVTHTFVIKNTGNASLEITRVRAACGCTTTALASNSIAPGATTEISARLSLAGKSGDLRKAIYIDSNDPTAKEYKLELVGSVQRIVDVRPQQAVMQVSAASPAPSTEIHVMFNGPTPHVITGIETNNGLYFTATLSEVIPGHEYAIAVQTVTNLNMQTSYLNGEIVVITDEPTKPRIQIPVVITQVRDVVVAPNQLMLPSSVPPGSPVQQQILIRNRTPTALEILSVDVPPYDILVATQKLSAAMYRIDLTFTNLQPDLNGKVVTVHVRREGAADESYEVPIQVIAH